MKSISPINIYKRIKQKDMMYLCNFEICKII